MHRFVVLFVACLVVAWLVGLVVLIVPLFLSFLAMPGLCCFLRVTQFISSDDKACSQEPYNSPLIMEALVAGEHLMSLPDVPQSAPCALEGLSHIITEPHISQAPTPSHKFRVHAVIRTTCIVHNRLCMVADVACAC